ncbi:Flp pilus assembly complex ATPase component TadA [Blastopirellula sp. JC732]|uniref:Flp pilus assembly complex ATPase component TadA n=1 Tax=Blastopirellula sediminis TaxID=2894196 RepID=A0A9X1MLY0_9BACT|nr:ATPase, T2SS/T4P/T4SS family [Blastopirellula sediminis]MCC9607214.1 Flp pilus assembly complex ATPase component TadA [Blastopirellula sediminis]MCC9629493.1 Flp pilus assembly complex ATPase component TadA [Blastopirellula sediminis]
MQRISSLILATAALAVVLSAPVYLSAQEGAAAPATAPATETPAAAPAPAPAASTPAASPSGPRIGEPGDYGFVNPVMLLMAWGLYLCWVYSTTWVSVDSERMKLSQAGWVSANFWPFFLLSWAFIALVPFFLGFFFAVALYVVPLWIYINKRNAMLDPHLRVMTPDHIRFVMSQMSGGKVAAERKEPWDMGPSVELIPKGGSGEQNTANLYNAKKAPDAYVWVKELIAEIHERRASKVLMDYGKDNVQMKYFIDGVWHAGEARDRESSDLMLALMKLISALKPEDRRSRQQGTFGANYGKAKYTCKISSQGVPTGERVLLELSGNDPKLTTLIDLGMREKLLEEVKQAMLEPHGLFIFSARPEGGLSTLYSLGIGSTDRLIRDFAGLEKTTSKEPEILNVNLMTYDPENQAQEQLLPTLLRKQPDVLVFREIDNATTMEVLIDQAAEKNLVFTSTRAKEAVEAILRVMAIGAEPKAFAQAISASLNMRLCRRLCDKCREPFQPTPQMLQKLGIPAGRVDTLYRAGKPNPEDPKSICTKCGGIGYYGRVGIFEFVKVNDAFRKALVSQPRLETLRAAAKQAGNRTMQEEGILLAVSGVTSLEEIGRALKE